MKNKRLPNASRQEIYQTILRIVTERRPHDVRLVWTKKETKHIAIGLLTTVGLTALAIKFGAFMLSIIKYKNFIHWVEIVVSIVNAMMLIILCSAILIALAFWLRGLVRGLCQTYSARKKGFFLRADTQVFEYCLLPAIAWRDVQAVECKYHEDTIGITLHAQWLAQHTLLSKAFYRFIALNITQHTIYIPCQPFGKNKTPVAAQLGVLHRDYAQRMGAWSPTIVAKLSQYGKTPENWIKEHMESVYQELDTMKRQSHITELQHIKIEVAIQQLNDFFVTESRFWAPLIDELHEY